VEVEGVFELGLESLHEFVSVVVAAVGAAVDHPAPCSVAVFLEVAVDVVGVVEPGFDLRPSGDFGHCVLLGRCWVGGWNQSQGWTCFQLYLSCGWYL